MSRRNCPTQYTTADQLRSFALGMLEVVGAPNPAPPGWVEGAIFDRGMVGWYDGDITGLHGWLWVESTEGIWRYNVPLRAYCSGRAGGLQKALPVVDGAEPGLHLLRANTAAIPPRLAVLECASRIDAAKSLLDANLIASKRTQIITCDRRQKSTVEGILEDAADGRPSILDEAVADIRTVDVSVPFIGNEVHALIQSLNADALKMLGGITPTAYKAERVQTAEVEAQAAEAIDQIYLTIDTFNADSERAGLPWRLRYRGFGARIDEEGGQTNE